MNSTRPRSSPKVKIPKHPTLIRRHLLARRKELHPQSPVLAASIGPGQKALRSLRLPWPKRPRPPHPLPDLQTTRQNPHCPCPPGLTPGGPIMDWRTPTSQTTDPAHLPTGSGPSPDPCHRPETQSGKVLALGRAFIKTLRHFWPKLNLWLKALADTRFQP